MLYEKQIFYSNTFAELSQCLKGICQVIRMNYEWLQVTNDAVSYFNNVCTLFISSQWISLNVNSTRSCNNAPHSAGKITDGNKKRRCIRVGIYNSQQCKRWSVSFTRDIFNNEKPFHSLERFYCVALVYISKNACRSWCARLTCCSLLFCFSLRAVEKLLCAREKLLRAL